jgi:hypothetical protein
MRPVHPGVILGEKLREIGMSATALGSALGVPANRVTAIVNGQRGVTADTALRLARYFGLPARYWMDLQQSFEIRSATIKSGDTILQTVKPRLPHGRSGTDKLQCAADDENRSSIRCSSESTQERNISICKEDLAAFCEANGISKLAIFGSALREDFDSDSDVDFLVEFEPGRVPGLFGIAGIEIELSKLIGGRKADVRTAEDLSRYFRDRALRAAEVKYARR